MLRVSSVFILCSCLCLVGGACMEPSTTPGNNGGSTGGSGGKGGSGGSGGSAAHNRDGQV